MTTDDWRKLLAEPPPWVWDSAAPYFSYIQAHEDNNRFYWGCRLAVVATSAAIKDAGFHWDRIEYEAQHYPWKRDKTLDTDKEAILLRIAERAIVTAASNFDMFLACWIWNMMLSLLEQEGKFVEDHRRTFKTVIDDQKVPPWRSILACFSEVKPALKRKQPYERNPRPGRAHAFPEADAWEAIRLWHSVRDRILHMDSIADETFFKQSEIVSAWYRICEEKGAPTTLIKGKRFVLGNKHVTACFANYTTAARELRDVLRESSDDRRGHVDAPGPFQNRKRESVGGTIEIPDLFLKKRITVRVR